MITHYFYVANMMNLNIQEKDISLQLIKIYRTRSKHYYLHHGTPKQRRVWLCIFLTGLTLILINNYYKLILMATKQPTTTSAPQETKVKREATKKEAVEAKVTRSFTIDCTKPVEDKVFNTSNFAEYLRQRIKIGGRTGHLGESVKVANDEKKVTVRADIAFSKRYLKYLTKKYLKRHSLRQFLYVVAANKTSYQIKYFNIQQEGADQE